MIDVSLTTNIQDASVYQFPLDLVSDLLQQVTVYLLWGFTTNQQWHPNVNKVQWNTQVPRYLLFYDGGIFSTQALTLVGTKLITYMGKML